MHNLYLSNPSLLCFGDDDVTFDERQQAKVNTILAESKRSLRGQLDKTERQLAEANENKSATEQSLEEARQQLRVREEQTAVEKKKHQKEVDAYKKRADEAEQKYNTATIHNALRDAAVAEDAFNPAILVEVLRERAAISPDGTVLVEFSSKDVDTGKELVEHLSPADAVKRLKAQPDRYGGLFRQFVAPKESAQPGKLDVKTMSTDEYMRLRRENPKALGL